MMVEWTEIQLSTIKHCKAVVGAHELSVVGNDTTWAWMIRQQEKTICQGIEDNQTDARLTAEAALLRVQSKSAKR